MLVFRSASSSGNVSVLQLPVTTAQKSSEKSRTAGPSKTGQPYKGRKYGVPVLWTFGHCRIVRTSILSKNVQNKHLGFKY